MNQAEAQSAQQHESTPTSEKRPKYFLDIEGTIHPWHQKTITTEEIAQLGGWDVSLEVIEVDEDNVERTLKPGEIVELRPGKGFGKKHRWKRG